MLGNYSLIDIQNLYHRLPRSIPAFAILAIAIMLVAGLQPTVDHITRKSDPEDPEPSILAAEPYPDSDLPELTRGGKGRGEGDPIEMTVDALIDACDNMTDTDGDGLPDSVEAVLGTDFNNTDTDRDGLDDNYEIRTGLDPLEIDSNNDGMGDYHEIMTGPSLFSTGWETKDPSCNPEKRQTDDVTASWNIDATDPVHKGSQSFEFSGTYNGDGNADGKQYFYLELFNLDLRFGKDTRLSYWIYHKDTQVRKISIDGKCTDGTTIRDANKDGDHVTDQYGIKAHPSAREDPENVWYFVEFDLSVLEGKTLDYLMVAFDHKTDEPGSFTTYLDQLRIWENDIDGGGTPNAWDSDNDGDGVKDSLDLSPFTRSTTSDEFQFNIKTGGNPTYLDFQIRPKNPDHMKLSGQTWDWPHDNRGQMQDLDGSGEDVRIHPMLELTMNHLPEQSRVNDYSIAIRRNYNPESWSSYHQSPHIGGSNAGGGADIGDINGNGKPDALLMGIDDPSGGNKFWYKVAWDLKSSGAPSSWSSTHTSPSIGNENAGGGAALADINGNGKLDLVLMGIDDPSGDNRFWYMVGWDLDHGGKVTSWSNTVHSPHIGYWDDGGGATIADIDGNGELDLLLMAIDDPSGANKFRYQVAWNLKTDGLPTSWGSIHSSPKIGNANAGGGASLVDLDGNGHLDLLLMGVDAPKGPNAFWHMVGWDLGSDAKVSSWSDISKSEGIGTAGAGGGAAVADIDGNGQLDFLFMGIDDPSGANTFRYRIGWNIINRAYVPLYPVKDKGTPEALQGRMFLPASDPLDLSVDANLVWMVNAQTDEYGLKVISGTSSHITPGSGWTKFSHDLNAGAGGKYIYLCVRESIEDDVKIISGSSSGISPGSGWTKINQDLNAGAGGDYIYLCVKGSLVNNIKVISGSSSHISAGTGWTKVHNDLNEGAGGKYIYICIKNVENNPAIITKTIPLATYREDFMLTGFTMSENHGSEAGVFYSADRNQTLKAYVALNYDFLKNQTPLSQAPDKLSEYNIDVDHDIRSFSHLDASVKGMTNMVRDAMKKLPDGKVLPMVLVGTDTSSNCAMGEFAAGSTHPLGTEFHVDLTNKPDVTMKSLNTVWVDTSTEKIIQFDELVQEVKTWEWDDVNETADMALLFFLWNVGETVVIKIDTIEIEFEVPETPEILEKLHQSFSGFEHLVGPIVESLAKYYWTRTFDKVKFAILDDLNLEWGEMNAETQEFTDMQAQIAKVGEAKNYAQLDEAVGGEVMEEQLTGIGAKLEIFAKALMIIGILIVIGIAIYTFISIANAGGWSGFSIALGIAVVAMQIFYFLIVMAIFAIPVVGWIIGLIIILADIIASIFHYGSGWIMKKIIDAITDFKLRAKVHLDLQHTHLLVTDHDDNGLTAGDRIEMRSRIIEHISKTDDGDHSDVTDSYITPHYRVGTHSCSDAGMGITTKSGTFRHTLYRVTHDSWREVGHDVGLWVEPGCSMINFPITTRLHADYKIYYKECCCWICSTKSKSDSQTSDPTTFYFDVLPNTLDDFLGWNAIIVNDRDADGLQDNVEACDDVYYELVQNATGKVMDGSSGSMYMLDWRENENQKWNLEHVENGEFRITQKASGQVIDGNGADMYLNSWNGGDFQRWELDPVGGGYYRIRQNATGKVIDGNGDDLYMRNWNGGDYQKWKLQVAGTESDPYAWDSDGDGLSDWFEVNTVIEYGCSAIDADSDDDGLHDGKELELGTSPIEKDTDDDGLTDYQEYRGWKITFIYCGQQFTGHVWSNPLTNDSDFDGLTDYEEYQQGLNPRSNDTDGDGIRDTDESRSTPPGKRSSAGMMRSGDQDTDNDGLSEETETTGWNITFTNSTGIYTIHVTSDPLLPDTDHDGLSDGLELTLCTNPRSVDTDSDGLSDAAEHTMGMNSNLYDADGDGLDDAAEMLFGCDPAMSDSDSDGLPDDQEVQLGSDPTCNDTDNDGLDDAVELLINSSLGKPDSDGDLLFDKMEYTLGTDPWNPDTDGDGLGDGLEYFINTDPLVNDTDSDGLPDGRELDLGLDPSVNDTDGDGLDDRLELELGSNPISPDTDNDRISDSRDHDTFVRNVDEIILVFDPSKDSYGFNNRLSEYVNITEVTPAELRTNYSDARYIVIVGRPYPDPENDTAGNLMYDIVKSYGWNLTPLQESGYDRITLEYGLWNNTQTIVMLSHPYPSDHWRVLSILKGMNVTVLPDTVRVEYPAPRPFFRVDAVREVDTSITVKLLQEVTPDVELHRYNASTTPTVLDHGSGLIGDEVAVGQYLEIITSANVQNETHEIIDFVWFQLYFTAADLDRNGDMDGIDPEDVNESTLCVYYFDGSKNMWIRLTKDLDWVFEVGLNTTNAELYGKEYEGYVWVNVSHLCLFGLAGKTSLPPEDEKEEEGSWVGLIALLSILALLVVLLLSVNIWYDDKGKKKKDGGDRKMDERDRNNGDGS